MNLHSADNIQHNIYLTSLLAVGNDVVIFLSPEKIITEFNSLTKKLFSWDAKQIIGRTFESIYQTKTITPFSLTEFTALLSGEIASIENLITVKNGQKINILWSIINLNEFDSTTSGFIIIGRNITDKKKFEAQLQSNRNQLERISSCVPGNFYWKNIESEYLGCNQSLLTMLGLHSIDDIVGKTDYDLWPDQAVAIRQNDIDVMNTGQTIFFEEAVSMTGKDKMYFTVIKMPLLDAEGKTIGILGNSLNITELKNTQAALSKAKEAAEAANHAKTEFIANMSHDIRTPLTGIIGMAGILEEETTDPHEKESIHMLNASGEQLLSLLNSILDIISADHITEADLKEETFDLRHCIQDIVELEQPTLQVKGLELRIEIDETLPKYIVGDQIKIHRILLNLLGNAIKFTPKGFVGIEIKCLARTKETVQIEFRISDSGIGIPSNAHDKVFDRFYRETPSYKGTYDGNGVGLHIAQSYVQLLGGNIQLDSKKKAGTTFYFDLSFKIGNAESVAKHTTQAPQNTHHAAAPLPQGKNAPPNTPLILLVEDAPIALTIAEAIVKKAGCRFLSATNGEQALELFKANPISLVITDIGLPGISGNELVTLIRTYETQSHKTPVPIVGLTAHAVDGAMNESIEAGMNLLIPKPLKLDVFNQVFSKFFKKEQPKAETQSLKNDLPATEEELFDLEKFPLLNINAGLENLGSVETLKELLQMMIGPPLTEDMSAIQDAYDKKDWDKVEALAHKIKSGAVYCSTTQLAYACQYLERYHKAGHSKLLEELYQQFCVTVEATKKAINEWLNNHPSK